MKIIGRIGGNRVRIKDFLKTKLKNMLSMGFSNTERSKVAFIFKQLLKYQKIQLLLFITPYLIKLKYTLQHYYSLSNIV